MHSSMIESVTTSMWVAFESGDKGVDYFVMAMSVKIFKVGLEQVASRCSQVSFCASWQRRHCGVMLRFRIVCFL